MKVISLKEPYASLIANNIKTIETRSWKTNYRGELYIHASLSTDKKEYDKLKNLIDFNNLNNGYIICKCTLVDCIYMTKEYVKEMQQNYPEYICGVYEEGRFAWILKDITPINKIPAKGQLGVWNYQKK